jgi:hypothetical protein
VSPFRGVDLEREAKRARGGTFLWTLIDEMLAKRRSRQVVLFVS